MQFEDALIVWAAKKYNIPRHEISRVSLDLGTEWGGYCETCAYEYPVIEVNVTRNGESKYYQEDRYYLQTLLNEIVDAANGI